VFGDLSYILSCLSPALSYRKIIGEKDYELLRSYQCLILQVMSPHAPVIPHTISSKLHVRLTLPFAYCHHVRTHGGRGTIGRPLSALFRGACANQTIFLPALLTRPLPRHYSRVRSISPRRDFPRNLDNRKYSH